MSNNSALYSPKYYTLNALAANAGYEGAQSNSEPFWPQIELLSVADRWNKAYPYRLHILNEGIVTSITLPIPPEAMTISTPFASNVAATIGGIVEQHNGAPFRNISLQGTTGVLPNRGRPNTNTTVSSEDAFLNGIFLGALNNFSLARQYDAFATGTPFQQPLLYPEIESATDAEKKGTGFYQFKLIEHFLEQYAHMKKRNPKFRLCFSVDKENAHYLVTPVDFQVRRDASAPLEYRYSLTLKAWRRIKDPASFSAEARKDSAPNRTDPLFDALNQMKRARQTVEKGIAALAAGVPGAVETVTQIARETSLFVKVGSSGLVTMADMPRSIIASVKYAILSAQGVVNEALAALQSSLPAQIFAAIESQVSQAAQQVSTGQAAQGVLGDLLLDTFQNFAFFDAISPSLIALPPAVLTAIQREVDRVSSLTRDDFEGFRDKAMDVLVNFGDFIGLNSPAYDSQAGREGANARSTEPTDQELEVMYALADMVDVCNRLAVSNSINRDNIDPIEFVAGLARRSGIAFQVPQSKRPVPFPYGYTLERLALTYLGDANRWHEIATLNGLRAPYVDEVGFDLPLLTDGKDGSVVVSDTSNLYVGQPVSVWSNAVAPTQRKITNIVKVNSSYCIVTLSGEQDLDSYTVANKAQLHAFLPDTVNSQQTIYIPAEGEATGNTFASKDIAGVDMLDPLFAVGGADLLLDESGDIVITETGSRWAVGLTNIVQHATLAVNTPKGTLLQHPDYGLGLEPGTSVADLDAKQMLKALSAMFQGDPVVTTVENAAIAIAGPTALVNFTIRLPLSDQRVSLTASLR